MNMPTVGTLSVMKYKQFIIEPSLTYFDSRFEYVLFPQNSNVLISVIDCIVYMDLGTTNYDYPNDVMGMLLTYDTSKQDSAQGYTYPNAFNANTSKAIDGNSRIFRFVINTGYTASGLNINYDQFLIQNDFILYNEAAGDSIATVGDMSLIVNLLYYEIYI